ncbi:hypothetical protein AB0E01_00080 [Nocardia vinacea]|uniref:hypothetical protein n=1 Tax=Nocardia vinacea TaxID=96468 RepID=UPI0034069CE6
MSDHGASGHSELVEQAECVAGYVPKHVSGKSYVRWHQPHADVTALIGDKLGPALNEVACRRSG